MLIFLQYNTKYIILYKTQIYYIKHKSLKVKPTTLRPRFVEPD